MKSQQRVMSISCCGLAALLASGAAMADPGLGSLAVFQYLLIAFLIVFVCGLLGLVPGLVMARRMQSRGETECRLYRFVRNASLTYIVILSPAMLFLLANLHWGFGAVIPVAILAVTFAAIIFVFGNFGRDSTSG